jgi:hypothetical protein
VLHSTVQVIIEQGGRPAAIGRSEFTTIDDLTEVAVRWWMARPELVTDAETATLLTEAAHRKTAQS